MVTIPGGAILPLDHIMFVIGFGFPLEVTRGRFQAIVNHYKRLANIKSFQNLFGVIAPQPLRSNRVFLLSSFIK